ncbi:zf-HC2 domain-containing protein [Seongchinamella sediminis]|uniref:Zf-HC2 domain-containing protein n=1 Tax=Seongchinamella sediminis TaxID=2283635 RepID=A0A3L7DVT9_9GAMM|nr:zf-HC2 domain-containing protein [Seongchinamella sediminis]RLQ20423.1 zf-HC2 domain-containing protein [Seongchinamella sediminis]
MTRSRTDISHEEVALLLPAFIHGQLNSRRQRQVQEHIATCASCAAAHRRDLQWVETMSHPPGNLEALLASDTRNGNRLRLFRHLANTTSDERKRRWGRASPPWFALAATAVFLGVVVALQWQALSVAPTPITYQTRSTVPTTPSVITGPALRVVFSDEARHGSVQKVIRELGARVVDGPSARGSFTLVVPPGNRPTEDVLDELRARPEVLLAELASHSDR